MIIVVSLIVLASLFFWPYMWEGEILGKWASIVTILSLVGAPIAYFVKQDDREKEKEIEKERERKLAEAMERERKLAEAMERRRTSKNLYGELFDTLSAIKGGTFPKDLIDVNIGSKTFTFTNRFLNHDIYDSLIFSGGIKFLDSELLQKTQNIFNMIKNHNHYLRLALDNRGKDNKVSKTTMQYYVLLDKYERQLLDEIPRVMDHLEKKFGFKPSS